MEINDKIVRAYSLGHWIDDRAAKVLRDALQQAVAENLKLKFNEQHQQIETKDSEPGHRKRICLAPCNFTDVRHEWTEKDWLDEADKLLRGEHD